MKDILKGTSKLFVSNLLAQALSLLLMIFVCRKYYSPADLELFTLFQSAMNFFGVLFFFRLDTLFYIEKEKDSRDQIYRFALLLVGALSFVFFLVNLVFNIYRFDFTLNFLLLFGMALNGYFNISQSRLINEHQINIASLTRLAFPVINFVSTYLLIIWGYKDLAMVLGLLIGLFFALLIQLFFTKFSLGFDWIKLREQLMKYKKDLLFSNLIFVINSFRDTLFIFFIFLMYTSKDYVASYSQGLRIVALPSVVLSGAIGTVLGSKLKIDMDNKDQFRKDYFKLLTYIIGGSLLVYILAFIFMDLGVELLFGRKWMYVSSCAKSLIPWFFINFILNALNGYFLVLRLQLVNFIINFFEISLFICTFLVFGSQLEFAQTLLFASLWSLLTGGLLIILLSKKILIFTKK